MHKADLDSRRDRLCRFSKVQIENAALTSRLVSFDPDPSPKQASNARRNLSKVAESRPSACNPGEAGPPRQLRRPCQLHKVSCRQPSPSYCLSPHPTNDAVDAQNGHGSTSCRRLILQPRKTCPSLLPHSTHSLLTKGFAVWLCCAACCWWVFPQRPRLETAAASSVAHTHLNYRPVTLLVVTILSQPPSIVDSIPPIPPTTDMPFRG